KIPGPLRDRMEIIHVPGYTPNEKLQIGKRYLLKKSIENNGLHDYELNINDITFMNIIRGYTKEAGVRELERQRNTIARKTATEVVTKEIEKGKKFNITGKQLKKLLGP